MSTFIISYSVSATFSMISKTKNYMWAIMCYCVVYSARDQKKLILRNWGISLNHRLLGFPLISCWSLFPCAAMIHSLDHKRPAHPPCFDCSQNNSLHTMSCCSHRDNILIALVLHWFCPLGLRASPPEIICQSVFTALKSFSFSALVMTV